MAILQSSGLRVVIIGDHIVQEFFEELQLEKIKFNGCASGLRSDYNDPIRKPWSVATNNGHIFRAFAKYSCPGKDRHPYHEPCAGKYTKKTEGYTWPFADVVHKAWKNSQIEINRVIESREARYFRKLNRKAIPAMPCNTNTETKTTTQHLTAHRPRSQHHPAYNAMVARLLTTKEVNSNPKAQQAILEEGEKLLKQGVWDVNSVREKRDAIRDAMKNNKKVHFARFFSSVLKRVVNYPRVTLIESLRGDVSSKAMMLETKTHTQLYFRSYPLHQLH